MKSHLKQIFIFAAVFFALFNSHVFAQDFNNYKSMPYQASLEILKNSAYVYLALSLLFFGLSCNWILFSISSVFLFLSTAVATYYTWALGITITPEIIKVVFHNDVADAFELVSIKILLWGIFCFFTIFYLLRNYLRNKVNYTLPKWYIFLQVILLTLSVRFLIKPDFKIFKHFMPWQVTSSVSLYLEKSPQITKTDISKEFEFSSTPSSDKVVVLVIGESARYDHFGVNGYERDTTPLLSKTENLFSFYANSCASVTYLSVSCILSRHEKDNFDVNLNETSIISIFNKLGFSTSWFATQNLRKYFENQIGGTFYDEAKTLILPGGSALFITNSHDEIILPLFNDFLEKKGNKFIVIHTFGSHWDFSKRYPESFNKFQPSLKGLSIGSRDYRDPTNEELINTYDNSILYTDYILSNIINRLKDKNSFMIYVSDHAVSLGENGNYGQGGSAPEQFEIPFIFWGSNDFWKNNPNFKDSIASKSKTKLSHDYVFHSLLGCSGINSNVIDQSLNLCSNIVVAN